MPAHIEQRAHLAVLAANDEQRLAAQAGGEEIAGLAHLAVMPDAVPVAQDQPLHLLLEELLVTVELATERMSGTLRGDRLRAAMGTLRRPAHHRLR